MKTPSFPLLRMVLLTTLVFVFIPSAIAGGTGEVVKLDNSTLFMDYDEEIRNISSVMAWAEDTPIQFFETDREVVITYKILNNNFFELLVENSPYGTEREYSFIYCSVNEIPDYDRFAYHQENRCPSWYYAYKLRDIREGQRLNVKIPPLVNGTNAFHWYVGKGGKGGGGLPVCEGLGASISVNQTYAEYNQSFKMNGQAYFLGASSAGCSANTLIWQYQNSSQYDTIPTSTIGEYAVLSGRGTVMSQGSPNWQQWYTRHPFCEIQGRFVNVRIKFVGVYNARTTTVYSPIKNQECRSGYNAFVWTNPTPENNSVIDSHNITLNSSLPFYKNNTVFYSFNDSAYLYVPMDKYNTSAVEDLIHNYGMIFKDGMTINNVIDGIFGKSLNFSDDETDFTLVNNSNLLDVGTGDFTFVAWVKPRGMSPSVTTDEVMFSKFLSASDYYYFRFRQADYFQFYATIGGTTYNYQDSSVNPYLNNNEWNLLVVGFNRTTDKFYITINGQLAGTTNSASGTGIDFTVNKELLIGGFSFNYVTGFSGFNGTMDEVSFHNRLMSLEEIQMIYLGNNADKEIRFDDLPYGTYNFSAWHNNVFGFYNYSLYNVTLQATPVDDGVVWFMFGGFLLFNIGVYGYVRRKRRFDK